MLIGKIIQSHDHIDYVCQVYRSEEVEYAPAPEDYAFGTFVGIQLQGGVELVGLIYDTQLYNPDFGRMGPRLSPEPDLEVFSPDYLEERAILVGIIAIGALDQDGHPMQRVPSVTASADAAVVRLESEAVRTFHRRGDSLQLAYFPILLAHNRPLIPHLLLSAIDRLRTLIPESEDLLLTMQDELEWRAHVAPMGGTQ
jgi:hypothetical protein